MAVPDLVVLVGFECTIDKFRCVKLYRCCECSGHLYFLVFFFNISSPDFFYSKVYTYMFLLTNLVWYSTVL